jgi:hypothetical protein
MCSVKRISFQEMSSLQRLPLRKWIDLAPSEEVPVMRGMILTPEETLTSGEEASL